jgi:hypothetical protein
MFSPESFMRNRLRLFLKIVSYILVEVFGAVLLVSFLSMLTDVLTVLKFVLPIVALSSAASGFCTLDRNSGPIIHKHLSAIGTGIGAALLLYGILDVFLFFLSGEYLFGFRDLLVFLGIGAGFAELGGLLALKRGRSPL